MKKNNTEIKTYEPDNAIKQGYFSLFKVIFLELKQNRWLIYQLFKRDFLAIYKQSFIGILWAIIIPLISIGTFILLNRSGIFNLGRLDVPYPIFAVLGMATWQLFAAGLIAGSNSLVKAGSMIVKINFSKKSLVIASLGQSLISFLIQFFLAGILFLYYGYSPSAAILLFPILILPVLLLTLGCGFILSILNGIMRDIGNIIAIFMTFFMFLTPVLYSKPTSGILAHITRYNPLFYLVSVPRDLILTGHSAEWQGFWISVTISFFVFIFCLYVFHLAETRVTERI
ncbi:MAG: ABC transporter permease [Candidatus Aminicenantes bacterium]|nr:ABC transporter permease [Candidatus Aminicenantes bacterium]